MKAKIRNTEIYFDVAGMQLAPQGKAFVERPVLFLLHGGPGGDHLRFKQVALELQSVAQLIFIDHRGCGRSKKSNAKEYTLENNIEDIEALRKHLGLEKICILGASYGGVVAQGYAIRYPKQVDKIILSATSTHKGFIQDAKKYLNQHGNKKQIAIAEHLWNGTFTSSNHVAQFFKLMDTIYSVKARKTKKKVYGKTQATWSHHALNKGFKDFLPKINFVPQLHKIKCPTLILAGEKDWICSPKQSKIMAQHIPNSSLKIFKNAGHAIATDAHDQFIKAIQNFLKPRKKK